MKKALLIGVASVATVGLLAGFAAAQGMRDQKHQRRFMNFKIDSMLEDINATEQQRTQIKQIADQLFAGGMQLHDATQQAHKELMSQWQAEKIDSAKTHALVNQRIDELRAFADKAVDDLIKVHDVLTPEQRAQLAAQAKQHHRQQHRE